MWYEVMTTEFKIKLFYIIVTYMYLSCLNFLWLITVSAAPTSYCYNATF